MRRYVRRGSKGIALIDTSGDRERLRYVFDVSDTGTRPNSRSLNLWELREEHIPAVSSMLEKNYGVPAGENLADQLETVASQLAREYWEDNRRDILGILEDSFLEEYDEFNVGVAFRNAAEVSISYSLMLRCGLEPENYFEHEDFMSVFDFNTPETAGALGTAVSGINQQVLREIGATIRNYEREQIAERSTEHGNDVQAERGLSDPGHQTERTGGDTHREVRSDAETVSEGASPDSLEPSGAVGAAVSAPSGDRRDGAPEAGRADAADGEADRRDGGTEAQRPDEMGGHDEYAEGTGRGDHSERAGVQLTAGEPEPPEELNSGYTAGAEFEQLSLNLFLSEQEQISQIDEADRTTEVLSAFSFSQTEIDDMLRFGSNTSHAREHIADAFQKQKPIEEIAVLLQREFHGGYGIRGEHGDYAAWYDGDGIHLHKGREARYAADSQVITWEAAAERIGQLLEEGSFASNVELAEAGGRVRSELAQSLLYLKHDLSEEANRVGYYDVGGIYQTFRSEQEAQKYADRLNGKEPFEQPQMTSETEAIYPGEQTGLPYDIVTERLRTEPEHTPPVSDAQNFRITDSDLGTGGAKTKYQANISAIRLLKQLEAEGLQAIPEQQEVLSRYVGWGGLADAFDPDKENWRAEYAELKELLTPEEYEAARASTLNAHYTSPTVIHAMYEALENMGFESGNILEPSMGVGNFFGCLPESMQNSRLYGVELDSITGRIAKQLYPKADITVAGFETTDRRDFYDVAIGNVPFGQYQVNDRAYNRLGFSIHDYFFAKTLDQVRPGGVIAFVTSRYTMDKQSPEVRRYIAQRAELLGAIRLPNNAFKANAGTDVVSDIIFLQKRDCPIEIEPDWVHLGRNEDGFAINSYFVEHPEMILGRQSSENTQYGRQDFTVEPIEGLELAYQLHDAVKYIRGTYQAAELPELGDDEALSDSIPADPNVKNYSYTVVDGEVYYRQNSLMSRPALNATTSERVKGLVELRDCLHHLIDLQMDAMTPDSAIRQAQAELNTLYDNFSAKYGLINSRANALAFQDDSSYYLLCTLEELDEEKQLKRKADIFTKRTIKPHEVVTSVDTPSEALALSISEKACVDLPYMQQLTGMDESALIDGLQGVIFRDPVKNEWQTADEYLSGNVRQKLREAEQAASADPAYLPNVEALRSSQPKDLDASEIEVRLGATWIDQKYIQQFMEETFEPPYYLRRSIQVHFSPFTAEWSISGKSQPSYNDVNAYMTYGTERANAYRILEDTLNLRDVRIYDTVTDPDGKERRVLNSKETTLAQQKQQAIKDAFSEWIWRDPDRRQELVTRYNELFNSNRPREYDGSHITFSGMNPEIHLREHQLNAVAHILYGGNTLLAHEVGAGKTFEMVAAAMESKRLGLCHKPMFVVPNHLTEQWASEFLRLYPSANILAATKKDFEPKNRKKFCARIATGDYDAIIIGHSQFERIPVSMERQERLLREQIEEVTEGIEELKNSRAERFTIKSMERTKKGLETKLKKLLESGRKNDVVTFEELGVDRLYVDEAHAFKNLFLYTKMRNVAGLSTTDAQKSSDMLLKCRYIDELTGGKGVVFATGTPVSNSMTELYTMMRYLQHDTLQKKGLAHFDCWASTFGETTTAIELAPEGTGYRARTRFAKFFNLPELMTLFKEVADIKTSDQLHIPVPEAVYHNVVAQPTEIQQAMVQELSERAAKVHAGAVDASVDNMLRITTDGRKLGLDQRIINPDLPDDPSSKVNMCVDNIYRIWDEGQADKLTQLVFCDLSTPIRRTALPA